MTDTTKTKTSRFTTNVSEQTLLQSDLEKLLDVLDTEAVTSDNSARYNRAMATAAINAGWVTVNEEIDIEDPNALTPSEYRQLSVWTDNLYREAMRYDPL